MLEDLLVRVSAASKDVAIARVRRRHRLFDHRVPRERSRNGREQVERDRRERPGPADVNERVFERFEVRPAPAEQDEQRKPGRKEQQG